MGRARENQNKIKKIMVSTVVRKVLQSVISERRKTQDTIAQSLRRNTPEAGRSNCLPYVLAPPSLSCESGG